MVANDQLLPRDWQPPHSSSAGAGEQGWVPPPWNMPFLQQPPWWRLMGGIFEAQLLVLHLGFGGSATFTTGPTPRAALGQAFSWSFSLCRWSRFVDLLADLLDPGL